MRRESTSTTRLCTVLLLALTFLPVFLLANPARSQTFNLRFKVYYLGMRVGDLRLQARDSTTDSGRRLRLVHLHSRTGRLAGALFSVKNEYTVLYDPASLQLLRVTKSIRQSNVSHRVVIEYSGSRATLHDHVTRRWTTPGPALDVVALMDVLLRVRARDTTFTVPLDQEAAPMKAWVRVYSGREGRFATAVVRKSGPKTRRWKTDLLTNRFSKAGARLEVRFRKDESAPYQLRYSLGPAMATARLVDDQGKRKK